jgi:hypothetical protein
MDEKAYGQLEKINVSIRPSFIFGSFGAVTAAWLVLLILAAALAFRVVGVVLHRPIGEQPATTHRWKPLVHHLPSPFPRSRLRNPRAF